jgi:hypothetical protein
LLRQRRRRPAFDGYIVLVCSLFGPPDGAAEIDLIAVGGRAGASADRTADERPIDRITKHQSTDGTDTGTDAGAAQGAIAGRIAATVEQQNHEGEGGNEGCLFQWLNS